MEKVKKKKFSTDWKYRLLLDLISIVVVATFAYTTSIIVVAYQMGA